MSSERSRLAPGLILFVAIWTLAVGYGMKVLLDFSTTPGDSGASATIWPEASVLSPSRDRYTLVMLAHPHCPCTGASLGELAKIMTRLQGRVDAHVFFVEPPGSPAGWGDTGNVRRAAAIPGVAVHVDRDGLEARRFGAQTSGQTLLYDSSGTLQFSGGITGERGHEGDNGGEDAIIARVEGGASAVESSSVLGCSLFGPGKVAAVTAR